jgi:hypothetical protein
MHGIHDVFPEDDNDSHEPISEKKLVKKEGCMSKRKTLLGFDFNGEDKTLWLEEGKRNQILTILHGWLHTTARGHHVISFKEFESVVVRLRHAFMALPTGLGLLLPCNAILRKQPKLIYMQRNKALREAIEMCHTLLRKFTKPRTRPWVAGLRGHLQCVFVWSGRGYCWQKQGVHPNSVPTTMASGHHG